VHLCLWEECAGLCDKVQLTNGYLVAHIGQISLALPSEMVGQLRGLEGKKITILRTDNEYIVRILDKGV